MKFFVPENLITRQILALNPRFFINIYQFLIQLFMEFAQGSFVQSVYFLKTFSQFFMHYIKYFSYCVMKYIQFLCKFDYCPSREVLASIPAFAPVNSPNQRFSLFNLKCNVRSKRRGAQFVSFSCKKNAETKAPAFFNIFLK